MWPIVSTLVFTDLKLKITKKYLIYRIAKCFLVIHQSYGIHASKNIIIKNNLKYNLNCIHYYFDFILK